MWTEAIPNFKTLREAIACDRLTDIEIAVLAHPSIVHATNSRGHTPLHIATFFNRQRSMKIFLDNGADKNAVDKSGRTARDIAVAEKCEWLLPLL